MIIDTHNPFVVPIGDNRHEPVKLVHPTRTGVMRTDEHRKHEAEILAGHLQKQRQLEKTAKRLKIKLPKGIERMRKNG